VLALDFDGVLCNGLREYFEASRRAAMRVWPVPTLRGRPALRARFDRLRPVIMSGWEMPVLLRALALGVAERRVRAAWPDVRETVVGGGEDRNALVARLRHALDDVRRDWIRNDPRGWLAAHQPYAPPARLRTVLASAARVVVVTTKEGEFARRILSSWGLHVDDVQGKEAGEHKCDNLLAVRERDAGSRVAFVEDRLETLECVARCSARDPRLADIGLFLASWGYTTPAARAIARHHPRIRLLSLRDFIRGVAACAAP
jgi:phosphoglycolate phosphatase-like HAD superfamily hydrolase